MFQQPSCACVLRYGANITQAFVICVGDAVTEFKSLRDAVVKCGSHQWYEIGLELGLKNHVIQSEAWDKSTSCSKLLALIEVKRKATGTRKTSEYLWRVCHQLPTPIDEDVQEELQIRGEAFFDVGI